MDAYVEQTGGVENVLASLGVQEEYHVHWEISTIFHKLVHMSDCVSKKTQGQISWNLRCCSFVRP